MLWIFCAIRFMISCCYCYPNSVGICHVLANTVYYFLFRAFLFIVVIDIIAATVAFTALHSHSVCLFNVTYMISY